MLWFGITVVINSIRGNDNVSRLSRQPLLHPCLALAVQEQSPSLARCARTLASPRHSGQSLATKTQAAPDQKVPVAPRVQAAPQPDSKFVLRPRSNQKQESA